MVQAVVQELDIETGLLCCSSGTASAASRWSETYMLRARRLAGRWDQHAPELGGARRPRATSSCPRARHAAVYLHLRGRTGSVLWRLGGRRSDFRLGSGARASRSQHDARPQPDGNDHDLRQQRRPGVAQALARGDHRARHRAHDGDAACARSPTRASCSRPRRATRRRLPGGGTFVGWGSQRWFTEYDAARNGSCSTATSRRGNDSYRAYRFAWSGRPGGAPKLLATTQTADRVRRPRELERGHGRRAVGVARGDRDPTRWPASKGRR